MAKARPQGFIRHLPCSTERLPLAGAGRSAVGVILAGRDNIRNSRRSFGGRVRTAIDRIHGQAKPVRGLPIDTHDNAYIDSRAMGIELLVPRPRSRVLR